MSAPLPGTLGRLRTDLGERDLYDAASQCSRCGYCEQSCPTYLATGREAFSPRGRNQLLRLTLEGKLDDPAAAAEAFSTCLLCGGCVSACYAKVPVPDLALEGRRLLRGEPHWAVRLVAGLLADRPRLFAALLKLAYLGKRLGLARAARPLLRAAGLGTLAVMDEHCDEAPSRLLDDDLRGRASAEAKWLYFAPCGPRWLLPRVGLATWRSLERLEGPGTYLDNPCCGLLAHNYGDLEQARALARRVVENAEAGGSLPVVGDCSSCVAHLKTYPQLFLEPGQEDWKARAEAFSARVRDAVEVLGPAAARLKDPLAPAASGGPRVTYHDSCRACHGQGLRAEPRAAVKALAGSDFREMSGSELCCGGAGAFAFTHEEMSDELLKAKVGRAAAAQADAIVTSSTSCLIQLARGLKTYYPEGRVLHLSEFVDEALQKLHGS